MPVTNVEIVLGAKNEMKAGTDAALREIERLERGATAASNRTKQKAADDQKGFFDQFKQSFGGESKLNRTLDLLRGTGIAAGLTVAGQQLNAMVQSALQVRRDLEAGAISVGTAVERLAGGLPILGQFWQLGRGIQELITGEEAAQERANAAAERGLRIAEQKRDAMRSLRDAVDAARKSSDDWARSMALLRLPADQREKQARLFADADEEQKIRDRFEQVKAKVPAVKPPTVNDRGRVSYSDFFRYDEYQQQLRKIDEERNREIEQLHQQAAERERQIEANHMAEVDQRLRDRRAEEMKHIDAANAAAAEREKQATEARLKQRREEERDRVATVLDEVDRIRESIMTPTEQLAKQIERLQQLKDQGLLTDEEFNRATTKAKGDNAAAAPQLPDIVEGLRISGLTQAALERQSEKPLKVEPTKEEEATAKNTGDTLDVLRDIHSVLANPTTFTVS